MGWLKRILKGFTSNSRRRSNGSCEDDDRRSCSDEPNDMEDESTEGEEEETDYQIARIRSFSEYGRDDLYGAASTKDWEQYDERPVQCFQQSLAFESFSLFDIANIFQPLPYSFYPDNGQAFLQPECVPSYASHGSLAGHEVSVYEDHSTIDKDHHLYHHHDHHRRHRPICYICGQPIPVDANGRLLYGRHPFWRQKYCRAHKRDGTPSCCGCERLKPRGSTYSTLSDGRWLCSECLDSAIMDDRAFKALEREMRGFYEGLGMKVHQRTIPLYLVNVQVMNEYLEQAEKIGHHRLNGTYGVTTWYIDPIYTTVEKPKIDADNRIIGIERENHMLVAHTRVAAIRVLDGLPRLFTGQILAHEMMHAWVKLEGYLQLGHEVEEGICEVLAHKWLGSQIRSMSKSKAAPSPRFDFQKRLAKFLQHGIESRTDYPYGTGFQLVKRATDMYGLNGTLDHIRMTGSFPR